MSVNRWWTSSSWQENEGDPGTHIRVFFKQADFDCKVYVGRVLSSSIDPAIANGNSAQWDGKIRI